MMATASCANAETSLPVPKVPVAPKRTGKTRQIPDDAKFACPGCHSTFDKWTVCLRHMYNCRPDMLNESSRTDCATLYRIIAGEQPKKFKPKALPSKTTGEDDSENAILRLGTVNVKLKRGAKCPFSPKRKKNSCACVIDETRLYHLRCARCSRVFDVSDDPLLVAKSYLWCRRRMRKCRGLLSVSVCLEGPSFNWLTQMSHRCGIFSNTSVSHVTFVEGLESAPRLVEDYAESLRSLRLALCLQPAMTIVALRSVARKSSPNTALILAELDVSYAVNKAADRLRAHPECAMPQFQYHVAVGACVRNNLDRILTTASGVLVGAVLSVGFNPPVVFPPSAENDYGLNVPTDIYETAQRTSADLNQRLAADAPWAADIRPPYLSSLSPSSHLWVPNQNDQIARSEKDCQQSTDLCDIFS